MGDQEKHVREAVERLGSLVGSQGVGGMVVPDRRDMAALAALLEAVPCMLAELARLRATVAQDPDRAQLLHELDVQRAAMATMLADERQMAAAHDRTRAERDAAREQVKRVRAVHAPHNCDGPQCPQRGNCDWCDEPIPCTTERALDGTEDGS